MRQTRVGLVPHAFERDAPASKSSGLQDITASGLVADLASRHRVIVFDRPGFGYSEQPRNRV